MVVFGAVGVLKGGQKLLSMDRAVHPKGARAALRALLTGPQGPYVRLVW